MTKRSVFWGYFFWSLGIQLAIFAMYVLLDASGLAGQFALTYETIYCWFSKGLLLRIGNLFFSDPWANVGFFIIIGPLIGSVIYSLLIAIAVKVWFGRADRIRSPTEHSRR